jgi:hypothetical protein
MQVRSFILRCAALIVMLVFLQKTGAGLLLHNVFHKQTSTESASHSDNNQGIGFACNCIDDFLMPFIDDDEPAVADIAAKHIVATPYYHDHVPFQAVAISSLRGPPSKG